MKQWAFVLGTPAVMVVVLAALVGLMRWLDSSAGARALEGFVPQARGSAPEETEPGEPPALVLEVEADGRLRVEGRPVAPEDVETRLAAAPPGRVLVRAAPGLDWGRITPLLDLCRRAEREVDVETVNPEPNVTAG